MTHLQLSFVLLSACRLLDDGQAGRGFSLELEAQENRERLFGREGDAVCFRGVSTHLGDLELLGLLPEAVAAVAAEILASEHVAADTPQTQLEAR
jgi:hypothetical protein